MARGIWQGTISFGLVEIPVTLVPAEQPNELDLTMLDKRDFSPIGYSRYNKSTKKEVAWGDIVRGYQYQKGEYVVLGDEELKQANPTLTKTVEILRFVDPKEIDPAFFEKPYYLAPQKKRSKGYVLLREALQKTNTVGVARLAIRTREHIALVGARDGVLVAYLLRYPNEIKPSDEIEGADTKLSDVGVGQREIQMAVKLIEDMTERWNPKDYHDRYSEDLMKLIERKVEEGNVHEIAEPAAEPRPRSEGKVVDLLPLLKRSLERARRGERPGGANGSDGHERNGRARPATRKRATRATRASTRHVRTLATRARRRTA